MQIVYEKVTEDASDLTHLGEQQTVRCLRDVMRLLVREVEKEGSNKYVGFGGTIQDLERSIKSTKPRRSEEKKGIPRSGYKWHPRRLKRQATFGIGSIHNGVFTIQPYCSYNAENKLQGSLIDVLIQLIDDVDQSFVDRSIDVIECMVYLAGNVTDALESKTLVITSDEAGAVLDAETTQKVTTTQATTKPSDELMESTHGPSTVVPATSTLGKASSTPLVISSTVNQPSTSVAHESISETATADKTTGTAVEMTETTADLSTTAAVSEVTSAKMDSTTTSEKSGTTTEGDLTSTSKVTTTTSLDELMEATHGPSTVGPATSTLGKVSLTPEEFSSTVNQPSTSVTHESVAKTAAGGQMTGTAVEMTETTTDLSTNALSEVTSAKMGSATTTQESGTTAKDEKAIGKLEKKASELKGMVTTKRKKLSILKKATRILSGLAALLTRNRLKRDAHSVSPFDFNRPFFIDLSSPDHLRIIPYCGINQENALKGTPAFLLLQMMSDIGMVAEGPTEQFDCLVLMLEGFQNLLGNGTVYIPSSANSEIREAIRNVNSSVQNLKESAKSALENMETELFSIRKDFEEKKNIDILTNKIAFIT